MGEWATIPGVAQSPDSAGIPIHPYLPLPRSPTLPLADQRLGAGGAETSERAYASRLGMSAIAPTNTPANATAATSAGTCRMPASVSLP